MKEIYTREEVVQLLVNERQRAIDIAYSFKKENESAYESKKNAGNKLAFINKNIAEECRYVGNAISGLTALSLPLNETIKDLIIRDLDKE